MTLTEEQKQKIFEDYESCKDAMYGNLFIKERKALGAKMKSFEKYCKDFYNIEKAIASDLTTSFT